MKGRGYAFLLLLCFAGVAANCHRETEPDRIKGIITTVQEAAGEKDVKTIINNLSKTYHDPRGNDYGTIKGLLLGYFFRHQTIHVYVTGLEATARDAEGTATFQAVLSGGGSSGSTSAILPEAMGVYDFDVSLKKENDDWKITSARWTRVLGSGS